MRNQTKAKNGASGWTPARRMAQSLRMRISRPWVRSTGPRTAVGKAAIRHNALKTGRHTAAAIAYRRRISALLRAQARFVRAVLATHDFSRNPLLNPLNSATLTDGFNNTQGPPCSAPSPLPCLPARC